MQADLGHPDPCKFENIANQCAATSTPGGIINLDIDEEWLVYEVLTEKALLRPKSDSPNRPTATLRDNVVHSANLEPRRQRPSRLTRNKNDVGVNAFHPRNRIETIFDERAHGDKLLDDVSSCMRKSLFHHVPPYVLFHSHDRGCGKKLPKDFIKLLKWKFSAAAPKILLQILINTGYQVVTTDNDWSGVWYPSFNDTSRYRNLKTFQKVNSLPGSHNMGSKDLLCMNLNRMTKKFGPEEFKFMPQTFVLPEEMQKFESAWQRYGIGSTWIIKPPSAGRGQGIKIINQWWEIPKWHSVIVQRYISKPKLINSSKFDLRVYVLVTSINPTKIYIYKEGLVRFASVRYVRDTNLSDKYMHLTNTSVNKLNPAYVSNDGVNSFKSHKWSLGCLWSRLREEGVDVAELWSKIKDIVVKTVIAAESSMNAAIKENLVSSYACYELYGFDVLLDENLKPWLLEVNTLPSLQTDSQLDTAVKGHLMRNVLNMAGYQIPKTDLTSNGGRYGKYDSIAHDCALYSATLNFWERVKQNEINVIRNRDEYLDRIVENLTRDDLRQLIRYEDELAEVGNFEKIFPTNQSYGYLKFFEVERYYDRLLDAWENRYSERREEAVRRLNKYCEQMRHLNPGSV
ncbi:tubulin monoglutamylase TTLL4-like [Hylaeus anthracinus]|uniref:tubulin monoglutamylase TTLL4-like n=1 Tax=Hylaeus anthracinus TaxID=313031 RepID=UPI0023B96DA1|nr:tubulin monoglutamylase TTLL4-like [Hylaeus anthracinus]